MENKDMSLRQFIDDSFNELKDKFKNLDDKFKNLDSEQYVFKQKIDNSFNSLRENIIEIAKDIISIKSAIGGNEFGSNGIIKKQAQTENRLTRLEKFYWKSIGALFVINILIIIFFQLIIK